MNLFEAVQADFLNPLISYRVKARADEIFGCGSSFVKNTWILKAYAKEGGVFEEEEKMDYGDYKAIKNNLAIHCSSAARWVIKREQDLAEEFLFHEDSLVQAAAAQASEDLEVLKQEKFKKRAFQEVYKSNIERIGSIEIEESFRDDVKAKIEANVAARLDSLKSV